MLDMDAVLERFGYLVRRGRGIDFARTRLYTYASPDLSPPKFVRFALAGPGAGGARCGRRSARRSRRALEADLSGCATRAARRSSTCATPRARSAEGAPTSWSGSRRKGPRGSCWWRASRSRARSPRSHRLTGNHRTDNDGFLFAAGPDIDPAAKLEGIHIHDMAPTLLYGLGPAGGRGFRRPRLAGALAPEYREAHPLRTIRSWGVRKGGGARASVADEKLLEELRALGYLN